MMENNNNTMSFFVVIVVIFVVVIVVIVDKSHEIRTMNKSVRTMVICVKNNPIRLIFFSSFAACPDNNTLQWKREKKKKKNRNDKIFFLFSFRCHFHHPQKSQRNWVNSYHTLLYICKQSRGRRWYQNNKKKVHELNMRLMF